MANITGATSYFTKAVEASAALTLTSSIASGATSVPITGLSTNYADGDVVGFVIEPASATAKQVFTGVVSGGATAVSSVQWTEGTNQPHSGGVTIVDYTTATDWALLQKGILVHANQNGTLNTATVNSITSAATTASLTTGQTATNLRVKPLINSAATATSLAPNINSYNQYVLTAQASALTIANPTGAPYDGDIIIILIKDNGTSQTITYDTLYSNISGLDTLTATVAGKWYTLGIRYNATVTKWQILSINTEA